MDAPILDHAVLADMTRQIGRPALAAVLELFISESRGFVATICADDGTGIARRQAAHSLKSSAAQIGAAALSAAARQIEAGTDRDGARLAACAAATEAAVQAWLADGPAP